MLSAIAVRFYMTPRICSNWFLPGFFYVCLTFLPTQWLTYGSMFLFFLYTAYVVSCLIGVLRLIDFGLYVIYAIGTRFTNSLWHLLLGSTPDEYHVLHV
jgi:hypothetical protein